MTKDDLKRLTALRSEIEYLACQIKAYRELCWQHEEHRKRFNETILMSSTDEACRVVPSRVTSSSVSPEEARAKRELEKLEEARAYAEARHNTLLADAEAWISTLDDWRVRTILRARYLLGKSVTETAEALSYSDQHVLNLESRFWGKNGK